MLANVDPFDGHLDGGDQRVDEVVLLTGDRDHNAIVVGVRIDVEHVRSCCRARDLRDHLGATALREVGNRFEQVAIHAPASLRAHVGTCGARVWGRADEAQAVGPAPVATDPSQACRRPDPVLKEAHMFLENSRYTGVEQAPVVLAEARTAVVVRIRRLPSPASAAATGGPVCSSAPG